jgi:hypothetical protein
MGGIITKVKHLVCSEFYSSSFSVCPRICNSVAHALAAIGCKSPSEHVITWEGVPQDVEVLVPSNLAGTDE